MEGMIPNTTEYNRGDIVNVKIAGGDWQAGEKLTIALIEFYPQKTILWNAQCGWIDASRVEAVIN